MDINYEIHYSKRRSISLQIPAISKGGINKGNLIIIKAPYGVSEKKVLDFVEEKRSWIIKKMKERQDQQQKINMLGFYTDDEIALIKKKAKEIIPQRVEYYGRLGGFKYNKIFIKTQRTLWGSCSAEKNLNFNCVLAEMPAEVLDAVVVHELCHLHHMDHSQGFYREVTSIFPDYKKWDKWLKENGGVYLGRIPR